MTARRLAAILAADIVGYSRLMGEDEADTARAVRERREAAQPIVANLGGRIVKTTGDGACLGFPRLSQRSNTRSRSRSDHQTLDMNSPSSPKVR